MIKVTTNLKTMKCLQIKKRLWKPHNPFIEYYENQALGKQQQIGHGFYTGLPWQKGYGIGDLLGSIARRFVPLLKPLVKYAGIKLLRAGTSAVNDIIAGKPVGDAARTGLKKFTEIIKSIRK